MALMVTISSAGVLGRPLFIRQGKTITEEMTALPANIQFTCAPKGFINGKIWHAWILSIIKEFSVSLENPALLLLDAYRSRENVEEILAACA